MKLIIQLPCFNEEHTLATTLADIPKTIPGIAIIETLVIDDGSTDDTVNVAKRCGVTHIIQNKQNIGLARTFARGLEACLAAGADFIVNTDGDNQYDAGDIDKLIAPLLAGKADIVIGDRQTFQLAHFSPLKRALQKLGSAVVQNLAGVVVPDTVSGFRAMTRDAALKLNIVSSFSYTTEMVIQAAKRQITVASVPVRTNPTARESRLFKSIGHFIRRSGITILRTYTMYQPLRVFFFLGALSTIIGALPMIRFLASYYVGEGAGHIQSLVIGGALLTIGFSCFLIGLLADLIAVNRQLLEKALYRIGKLEESLELHRSQIVKSSNHDNSPPTHS